MELLDRNTPTPFRVRALSLFPPPKIMRMHAVGIDISDASLKYILFNRKGNGVQIAAYGSKDIPLGLIEKGRITDVSALSNVLIKLRKQHGFEFAHVALPEEHAYLFETDVPRSISSVSEMKTVIEFRLKENVPLPPEETVFDFIEIGKNVEGNTIVIVSAYARSILEEYQKVFLQSGIHPISFEVEGQAVGRAVVPYNDAGTYMLVDLGKRQTGISIIRSGALAFAVNIGLGGDHLTSSIAKALKKNEEEAELIKQKAGFVPREADDEVAFALATTMAALRDEINQHYLYWHAHHEGDDTSVISCVYLVGGGAGLMGFAEYLSNALPVPVKRADVWTNVLFNDVPDIDRSRSFQYGTAIGLALRSI